MLKRKRPTSIVTIKFLHELFARFSYPETIITDNATQFLPKGFKMFCESFAINHITMPPFNPRLNGLVEKFVDTLKRALNKYSGRDSEEIGIQQFLQVCCITPNPSTVSGMSLVELMFARTSKKKRNPTESLDINPKRKKYGFYRRWNLKREVL